MILKERMKRLIALPSVSSVMPEWDLGNRQVIDCLAQWLEELNFKVEVQPVGAKKANLVATFGTGEGGLVLSGHTDTVPFNEERWQSDPLKLTERDNRFYGLGTCDMKGFFALCLEAFNQLREADFKHPLTIVATCDEETTMEGAKALQVFQLPNPRAVVIGEPTSLKPVRMHKSIMMNRLTLTGQSGHSSDPSLGNNALDAMHDAMTVLRDFRSELKTQYKAPAFAVAYPTMNFGCIHGGDNPNRICHSCAMDFDFRGVPGLTNGEIRVEIERRLQPVVEATGVEMTLASLFDGVEAFEQAADSELVQVAESLSGSSSKAVAFGTEAPFFKQMGIETLVLGAGSIDQAHQPDEFVSIDQVNRGVTLLEKLIQHYCL